MNLMLAKSHNNSISMLDCLSWVYKIGILGHLKSFLAGISVVNCRYHFYIRQHSIFFSVAANFIFYSCPLFQVCLINCITGVVMPWLAPEAYLNLQVMLRAFLTNFHNILRKPFVVQRFINCKWNIISKTYRYGFPVKGRWCWRAVTWLLILTCSVVGNNTSPYLLVTD